MGFSTAPVYSKAWMYQNVKFIVIPIGLCVGFSNCNDIVVMFSRCQNVATLQKQIG
jgi:hypothetical protein